ncbi:DsbA family protein [Klebsiella grimontii]|uniref:DsbA family protein n=1 Tax=Klebsiella grimontii TaxID=2058152 RepID=UPI002247E02E|nr:DsbA family protein [Klebsiella grimontii]MCW9474422.1 DsbA family protein [Klebsiella grimontii]
MKLKIALKIQTIIVMLIHVSPLFASETSSVFTPVQEKRIGEIAADYMRAHPDILIQMSESLQLEQQEKQTRELKSAALEQQSKILSNINIPSWGPANGDVMVVEFFDYQCIWCSRFAPELDKIIKSNTDVRYFFMEWPVFGSRWPESLLAARTGLQVWKEKGADTYLEYHNDIYGTGLNEGNLTKDSIEKISGSVAFESETTDDINITLKNINDIAISIGLAGTPGIIVMPVKDAVVGNVTVFSGMTEAEDIQAAINKARL